MNPPYQLVEPAPDLEQEYMDMLEDFRRTGEFYHQAEWAMLGCGADGFRRMLQRLREIDEGVDLPEGFVPSTTYWLVCGGRVLGTCRLRHALGPSLIDEGGHIGYDVRPSERNRGHATAMLALVLERARRRGLTRVLVTCNTENIASARVIQKNGGVFEDERPSPRTGKPVSRYWIDL